MKFEVGDIVKRVNGSLYPEKFGQQGKFYIVLGVPLPGRVVVIAGQPSANAKDFELIRKGNEMKLTKDWQLVSKGQLNQILSSSPKRVEYEGDEPIINSIKMEKL